MLLILENGCAFGLTNDTITSTATREQNACHTSLRFIPFFHTRQTIVCHREVLYIFHPPLQTIKNHSKSALKNPAHDLQKSAS